MVDNLASDRSQHLPTPSSRAVRAQDDDVGVSARVDELFGRVAVNRPDRNRLRAGIAEPGQHLVGFRLGRLGGLLGLGFVSAITEGAGPAVYGLVHHEHGKRGVTGRCFLRRPLQGTPRMVGTVHTDEDSRHLTSPSASAALVPHKAASVPPLPDARHSGPAATGLSGPLMSTLVRKPWPNCLELR